MGQDADRVAVETAGPGRSLRMLRYPQPLRIAAGRLHIRLTRWESGARPQAVQTPSCRAAPVTSLRREIAEHRDVRQARVHGAPTRDSGARGHPRQVRSLPAAMHEPTRIQPGRERPGARRAVRLECTEAVMARAVEALGVLLTMRLVLKNGAELCAIEAFMRAIQPRGRPSRAAVVEQRHDLLLEQVVERLGLDLVLVVEVVVLLARPIAQPIVGWS